MIALVVEERVVCRYCGKSYQRFLHNCPHCRKPFSSAVEETRSAKGVVLIPSRAKKKKKKH